MSRAAVAYILDVYQQFCGAEEGEKHKPVFSPDIDTVLWKEFRKMLGEWRDLW